LDASFFTQPGIDSSELTVTVILNVFRRGKNLEKQLKAIENQSHKVDEIIIWENGEDQTPANLVGWTHLARSAKNLGVWARFAFALNGKADFIWMIDDDTIPGARWLENALATFAETPGVIGSRGLRFRSQHSYTLYDEVGPNAPNSTIEAVDIVGHNWVFPRVWLGYFWAEYPSRFPGELAGEDIHLSYAVKKHLGLGTFVPPHPTDKKELWGEIQDENEPEFNGRDSAAISQNPASMRRFELAFKHYIEKGFTLLSAGNEGEFRFFTDMAAKSIARFPSASQRLARALRFRK